jgi:virulence-associated protein VagC
MPLKAPVTPERHVKLFKNGRNQAVRIPREFELPGEDAIMRKEGERLIIEPSRRNLSWRCWRPSPRSTRISRRSPTWPPVLSNFDALSA